MREILFRGKRIDSGEWEYGGCVFTENKVCLIYNQTHSIDLQGCTVEENSVGQYTGLTDKNGKKIFEGDICRMKADRLKGYGAIIFMGSAFVLCDKTHKQTRYYPLYPDGQFTVVGDIHDNPELLEVKE